MNPKQPYCGPGAGGVAGRIASYLQEVLMLSPAAVRGVGLGFSASLGNTTPVSYTYKVPSDQELVVFSVHGYLRFPTFNTEPSVILSFLNPDPSERWFLKSQNCLVSLTNIDRSLPIFDSQDVPLSSITPPVGAPLYFPLDAPLLVPAGHNLRATFQLQDSTAAIVGNSTVYGLMLTGALIPKRA